MVMSHALAGRAAEAPLSALRTVWQDYEGSVARKPDIRLGIAASFTAANLTPFVGAYLLKAGYLPDCRLAPYDHVFQSCLDPASTLGADCNCVLLLWRLEDYMQDELQGFVDSRPRALDAGLAKVGQLLDAVVSLRAKFSGTVILGVPPFPTHGVQYFRGLDPRGAPAAFHAAMASALYERFKASGDIQLLDLSLLQAEFGVAASLDWRQWYLYRQPFCEEFLRLTGKEITRIVNASRRAPRKCLVLDADNCLWGGIIGEDGLSGISIGQDFPGSAYRDFQRQLLHLRERGVLLAIASKNNEADVW
ncbi:MAG: hypothetical protein ACREFW_03430, partial [Rhizomicrobium sp.]